MLGVMFYVSCAFCFGASLLHMAEKMPKKIRTSEIRRKNNSEKTQSDSQLPCLKLTAKAHEKWIFRLPFHWHERSDFCEDLFTSRSHSREKKSRWTSPNAGGEDDSSPFLGGPERLIFRGVNN